MDALSWHTVCTLSGKGKVRTPIHSIIEWHSLFETSSAHYAVNSLHRVSTFLFFIGKEHIGFTKFHTTNSVNTLEAIYKPRITVHLL